MAITLEEFVNIIGWKTDKASLKATEDSVGKSIKKIRDTSRKMTLAMSVPIAGIAGVMVKLASDATETDNKFQEVFKGNAEEATAFAKTLSDKTGRSVVDLQNGMSAYQSQLLGLGFGGKEALEMSGNLQQMAIDFGSFHNASDPESMQRFISAMAGSTESLDMFGINLKSSNMDLKLQELGLAKSTSSATEAQKAIARMSIMKDTLGRQGALGDAVRTIDEFANSSRRFRSKLVELGQSFGKHIIPYLNLFMKKTLPIIYALRDMSDTSKKLIIGFALFTAVIFPLIWGFTSLYKAGMAINKMLITTKTVMTALKWETVKTNIAMMAIPILIGLAIVAIGVLVDDIMNWVNGNDSMLGEWLGSWTDWVGEWKWILRSMADGVYKFFVQDIPNKLKQGLDKVKELFTKFINSKPVKVAMAIFKYSPAGLALGALGKGAELLGSAVGGRNNISPVTSSIGGNKSTVVNRNKINVVVPEGTSQAQATNIVTGAINNASNYNQPSWDLGGALYETQGME